DEARLAVEFMFPTRSARRPGARIAVGVALLSWGLTSLLAASAWGQSPPVSGVTPPTPITHVDAVYPQTAIASRKHADVILAVTIDADGRVSKVDVLQSAGADLDEA